MPNSAGLGGPDCTAPSLPAFAWALPAAYLLLPFLPLLLLGEHVLTLADSAQSSPPFPGLFHAQVKRTFLSLRSLSGVEKINAFRGLGGNMSESRYTAGMAQAGDRDHTRWGP